jgi:hypothetical protein
MINRLRRGPRRGMIVTTHGSGRPKVIDAQQHREALRTGFKSIKEEADKDAALWRGKGRWWMLCFYALALLTIVSAGVSAYISGSSDHPSSWATYSAVLAAGLATASSTLRPGKKWDNAQSGERENQIISASAQDGVNDSDTADLDDLTERLNKLRGRRDAALERKSPE